MRLHYFQHVPFEDPAHLLYWARTRSHAVTATRMYANPRFPDTRDYDLLLVMGGPMSAGDTDTHAWLKQEKACIREAISAGKRILGICLGAQLIAEALGAAITPNPHKEIGWWPVTWTDAARRHPRLRHLARGRLYFHWHGDTFDLPAGAVRLARTPACANQAFLWQNRVLGLQFHPESTAESIGRLIMHCRSELTDAPYIQTETAMLEQSPRSMRFNHKCLGTFLDHWTQ